jgi:hypothetical protein
MRVAGSWRALLRPETERPAPRTAQGVKAALPQNCLTSAILRVLRTPVKTLSVTGEGHYRVFVAEISDTSAPGWLEPCSA